MQDHSSYWQRQTVQEPLFPDLLWSRPENRRHAGKLLIAGGNAYGFAAPAEAYAQADKAGIGASRVLLPDSLAKTLGRSFEAGEFAPSTPSGSFAQKALAELLSLATWSDAVLLAGDLGRNSETAILLEKFTHKYTGQLTLCNDAADYFINPQTAIMDRPQTTLVLQFAQLQKLASYSHFTTAFTSQLDLVHFIQTLHGFASAHSAHLVVYHLDNLIIAAAGKVSSTAVPATSPPSLAQAAAYAAVWQLQNPDKPFEALTTAMLRD